MTPKDTLLCESQSSQCRGARRCAAKRDAAFWISATVCSPDSPLEKVTTMTVGPKLRAAADVALTAATSALIARGRRRASAFTPLDGVQAPWSGRRGA